MKRTLSVSLCLIICFCFSVSVCAGISLPSPKNNYVNDFAEVLSSETEQKIKAFSAELEEKTKAEVTVVTISSLDGNDIASYANELFRKWGIGDKEKNNGVLLLIAVNDRESRIEVGYGLEGCLPDSKTGRIQDEYLIPSLKKGDYDTGILLCSQAITNAVSEEYGVEITGVPNEMPLSRNNKANGFNPFKLIFIVVFLLCDGIFFRFGITRFLTRIFFWRALFDGRNDRNNRDGFGGGSFGGGSFGGGSFGGGSFGGGSSGGGGSSRGW